MVHDIIWKSQLDTGIAQVDGEHRSLASDFNEVLSVFRSGASQEELYRGLAEIIRHTEEHFVSEEKVMESEGYPLARHHADEHKDLLGRFSRLAGLIASGRQEVDDMVLGFIKDWLVNHILDADARFGAYVMGQQSRDSQTMLT